MLTVNRQQLLGKGAFAFVFKGKLGDQDVAVKRLQKEDALHRIEDREITTMKELDHPNVIKLLYINEDENFRYIVMELCAANIDDYCSGKYTGPMPGTVHSMKQMASGLQHIHSKKFVHRDIKAANVLIKPSEDDNGMTVLLKISDFGFSKPASETGSYSLSQGGKGTMSFVAPELLLQKDREDDADEQIVDACRRPTARRGKMASDIFALGCLFFCFLTKGDHPFSDGSIHSVYANIHNARHFLERLDGEHQYARSMIEEMIQNDPKHRPSLDQIIRRLDLILE